MLTISHPRTRSFWPLRSMDWRLRLAHGRETWFRDLPEDDHVRAMRAFRRQPRKLPQDQAYRRYFPVLRRIFNLPFDRPLIRAELEAHVIGGRPAADIAARTGQ